MQLLFLLIVSVFASEDSKTIGNSKSNDLENAAQNMILVKIEEDEYTKRQTSNYIGVSYKKENGIWRVQRWSKEKNGPFSNGHYKDEETAAHASDTLARKLIANGEQKLRLNFPDDDTEVWAEKTSQNIGVSYHKQNGNWRVGRRSSYERKMVYNGSYTDQATAAHASDTLARKLIVNGEKGHKLNFPDDDTEVHPEKTSQYIGVSYKKRDSTWGAQRYSKNENRLILLYNGTYKDKETAAHASDTLARKLIANGEKRHKLNFPDDYTEVQPEFLHNKRKRPTNTSKKYGKSLDKFD